MARETRVQSKVASYQRVKNWYLIPPCLTLSIIRYVSRVKWRNPENGVALHLHLGVVAIEKGAFGSPLTLVANFTYLKKKVSIVRKIMLYEFELGYNVTESTKKTFVVRKLKG